ncbi:hypothetical protein KFL_006180020 [Klebsormidium nitens]|uniref:EGF-like domain-containing protein n=1 Tax=Klebsormidium nitens TaxID=105231 RepID=A0A1Y1IHA7_KLENI|nr:hypothetical protein KFL_006180020 [Klebsormidium nitens]|eukprot:GAQ90245.1 hypothetical protein KFL_006180020 [Klebsormidium nitens]
MQLNLVRPRSIKGICRARPGGHACVITNISKLPYNLGNRSTFRGRPKQQWRPHALPFWRSPSCASPPSRCYPRIMITPEPMITPARQGSSLLFEAAQIPIPSSAMRISVTPTRLAAVQAMWEYSGVKGIGSHFSCFIPGRDVCNPNPCENGGTCNVQFGTRLPPVPEGENPSQVIDFTCNCPLGFLGKTCALLAPNSQYPTPVQKSGPPSGSQGVCGTDGPAAAFPVRCYLNNDPQGRYLCCDSAGCDGFLRPRYQVPQCKNGDGYAPPGFGVGTSPPTPPATPPPSNPPTGSQGVCGSGDAAFFPTRCWFNSDPQGRYVCCDGQGCDGFNADNLTPHCKIYGYVPPNYGAGAAPPPPEPPTNSQGVCGTGAAASFPVRCWYNNDPQGRYVCCDSEGCDGFNPPGNFFPHCKNNGFVPPSL